MSPVKSFSPRISDDPTPYASTGTPSPLELLDLRDGEPAGGDDPHPLEPVLVERVTHLADETLVHAPRVEVAELVPERPVDELAGRVEPETPQPRAERAGNLERRADGVVLVVDENRDVEVLRRPVGELGRREHRVPP
jgi:hypothetical protein